MCCGGGDGVGLGAAPVGDGHDVGGRLSRETLIKADQDDAVGGLEAEQVRGAAAMRLAGPVSGRVMLRS